MGGGVSIMGCIEMEGRKAVWGRLRSGFVLVALWFYGKYS